MCSSFSPQGIGSKQATAITHFLDQLELFLKGKRGQLLAPGFLSFEHSFHQRVSSSNTAMLGLNSVI